MKAITKILIAATVTALAIGIAAWFAFNSATIALISALVTFTGLTVPVWEWRSTCL
jgi:hypothetical protein